MFTDILTYLSHYLTLAVILGGGGLVFFFFAHSQQIQFWIGVIMALAYLLWGIVHHYLKKDLNWLIVVEYTLVAIFSIVVIYSVLAQA